MEEERENVSGGDNAEKGQQPSWRPELPILPQVPPAKDQKAANDDQDKMVVGQAARGRGECN